jgi:cytochrome b
MDSSMNYSQTRVWDIAIRIFHWSLVAAFTIAYLTEDDFETLHTYAGYTVLGLVTFRILWGLIGTRYARFTQFIYSPARVIDYIGGLIKGKPKHYTGHNPAGGYMVLALLISLLATTWSGMVLYGTEGKGPLANTTINIISPAYADDDEHGKGEGKEGDEFWEEIHEFFANFTLFLVILHIAGVIVSSIAHRENLVRAMITGKKERHDE